MPQLLVRDVDPVTVERLKRRAKENGRSLQSEVRQILEEAARMSLPEFREAARQIRDSLRERKFTDSTLLIREDRER